MKTTSTDAPRGFVSVPPSSEVEEAALEAAHRLAQGLFPHQVEGVGFLVARRRAILCDDMGLGKSRQAIVALRHIEPGGPFLVICPASVKANWRREIHLVQPDAEVRIVSGSEPASGLGPGFSGWMVVNYDVLAHQMPALEEVEWKGLLFDEAHYLKNHSSKRSQLARQLALEGPGDPVTYALTGTPLTNRPRDLFPLLQLVRHPLGKSFLSFAKRYCAADHNGYGWVTDGASNLEELTLQLHGIMIRRRKEDVLQLPPKLRSWLEIEVPPDTALGEIREVVATLLRSHLRRAARDTVPGVVSPALPEAPERGDRIRLLAKLTKAREKLAAAKSKPCIEFVEGIVEQDQKVIVFSCFDRPIQALAKHFGDAAVVLTGATPSEDRQGLVDRFQGDPKARVFLANIVAGGIGLNLTAARHVVFNDLDWVPANHWQAEDRAYRIGQTGTVNVHYLVGADTIDHFVRTVLETKSALFGAVVDGKALDPAATRDVLSELERLVARLSPRLSDVDIKDPEGDWVRQLLRDVAAEVQAEAVPANSPDATKAQPPLSEDAIRALARVLTGPRSQVYIAASRSDPKKSYTLTVDGADVSCDCPGFEYRGMCAHARQLKDSLVTGTPLPTGFSPAHSER